MENILSHYDAIESLKQGVMPLPRYVIFQTSNRCQQKCRGCSYRGKLHSEVMSFDDHAGVIEEFLRLGVKGFEFCGGGEPLLLSRVLELMIMVIDGGGSFGLLTNGIGFTDDPELIDYVARKAAFCRVSFEAPTKELYCKYKDCDESAWYSLLDNFRALINVRDESKSKTDISMKFGVGKSLRGEVFYRKAIELAFELKASNIQFKTLRHEPEELSYHEKLHESEIIKEAIYESPYCIPIFQETILPYRDSDIPQCWLNPVHCVVNWDGTVYICCYYYFRGEEHILGNMLTQSFKDFWFSQEHWDKIKSIDRNKCKLVDCKFFRHHEIVDKAFEQGKVNYL